MNHKRIHRIYGWVLTCGLVIAGLLLICSCVSIYRMGDRPFSPQTVALAFSRICVPVYLCLGLIVGGFLLQLCLPLEEKKTFSPIYSMQLARLQEKLDLNTVTDEALRKQIITLRRKRAFHLEITLGLLILFGGVFLGYGLNPANFHQTEINHSMAMAMLLFFPCLAIPFGYGCFTAYYGLKLTKEEIALSRKALKETSIQPAAKPESWVPWVRLGLLCLGLSLLCYGFFSGGTADVLTKAINICTECVGLG